MKSIIFFLLIIVLFPITMACEKETNSEENNNNITVCGFKDPLNELVWLKDKMILWGFAKSLDKITLFRYKNQDIIEYYSLDSSSSKPFTFYCNGEMMDLNNKSDYDNYINKRKKIKVLSDNFPK